MWIGLADLGFINLKGVTWCVCVLFRRAFVARFDYCLVFWTVDESNRIKV